MGFCTRRVPAGFDYGFGFIGFHIETEFRVLSGSGIVKSQKFGFGFLRVSKKRPKPVGFSGSGKPDPPLLRIAAADSFAWTAQANETGRTFIGG